MDEKKIEELKKEIEEQFAFLKETREELWKENFQLALEQFDLLKTISGLIIGLSAIGYLYDGINLDKNFLLLAFVFGLLNLFISISWSRESIERTMDWNEKMWLDADSRIKRHIQKIVDAIEATNISIYNDFIEEAYKEASAQTSSLKPVKDYMGKLVFFLFFSSVGFLILAFFPGLDNFLKWFFTILILDLSFLLVYFNWATWINNLLNWLLNRIK